MKKAILLLFLVLSLFIVKQVDAAEILQRNGVGNYVTGPTFLEYQVKFSIPSNLGIKAIRHTKYDTSDWNKVAAHKGLKTTKTYSGFGYNCAGYYMTRFYSDSDGTQLIGWIRAYVAPTDIGVHYTCTNVTDTSKKLPSDNDVFNVSHASDLIVEPNKMIYNNTPVEPSEPIWRDNEVEKYYSYDENIDSNVVESDKACRQRAASTGLSYELRYNENTKSWQCVNMSDCMYQTGLWQCDNKISKTIEQKYANTATFIKNPVKRNPDTCSQDDSSPCTTLVKISDYQKYERPSDYLMTYMVASNDDTATGKIVNPDPRYEPNLPPQYDPDEILIRDNFAPGGCWDENGEPRYGYIYCEWDCDHPYFIERYGGSMCPIKDETEKPLPPDLRGEPEDGGIVSYVDPEQEPDPGGNPSNEGEDAPAFGDDENGDGLSPDDVVADSSLNDCAIKEICVCIAELKPSLEQINTSVGDVGEKIAAINPLFEQLDSSLNDVGEKIAALNPVLNDIKNGVADLKNDMNSKLATTNSKLTNIDTKLATTNTKLTNMDSKLGTSNTKLSNIDTKIGTSNTKLTNINTSVNNLKPVLDQIAENTSKNSPGGFSIESNEDANLNELPDISNVLDQNRPSNDVDRQDTFTYDKKVFEDQGDDTEGDYGKLAPIPEPKHWAGLLPEKAMPAQKELTKDTEIKKSKENEKDAVMQQSPELKINAMQKSPQLQVDTMQKSPQLQQQQLEQTEQYTRNHFYNQTK